MEDEQPPPKAFLNDEDDPPASNWWKMLDSKRLPSQTLLDQPSPLSKNDLRAFEKHLRHKSRRLEQLVEAGASSETLYDRLTEIVRALTKKGVGLYKTQNGSAADFRDFREWLDGAICDVLPAKSLCDEETGVRVIESVFDTVTIEFDSRAQGARATDSQVRRAQARSAWLDEKLNGRSDVDIEGLGGPTYKTIQKYRQGVTTSRTPYVRKRISDALKCPFEEVPE